MRLAPVVLAWLALPLATAAAALVVPPRTATSTDETVRRGSNQDPETRAPQDPVRPARAPIGADPLPPVPDPPSSPVERRDLLGAFAPASGFEGFYRLTGIADGGRVVQEGLRGYLAIGRSHLALHILQTGEPGLPPMVQAGFRRYRVEEGVLITTSLVGHDNLGDAKLHFEPFGFEERRGIVRTPTTLRVVRGQGAWMEFVRVE